MRLMDFNLMNFNQKRVWVTGAGQGIGRKIAEQFQELGADVIGFDKQFLAQDYIFRTVTLDIADNDQVTQVCQHLMHETVHLDVLINAAGVLRLASTQETSIDDWQTCFDVNVSGVFYLLRQLIPQFKRQRSGAIVTVASNAAHQPRIGMAAYGASKAALASLSHCVGLELASFGVRCNVVSPGSTDTPMLQSMLPDSDAVAQTIRGIPEDFKLGIPLGKIAKPADIANTVLFLASDLAGHITLQNIVVDGGATLTQ